LQHHRVQEGLVLADTLSGILVTVSEQNKHKRILSQALTCNLDQLQGYLCGKDTSRILTTAHCREVMKVRF